MSAQGALRPDGIVRTDTACRLLATGHDTEDASRDQAAALRGFVRRALLRRFPRLPGVTENAPAQASASTPWATAPAEPPETLFAFDIAALCVALPWRCHAVLAPRDVAAALRLGWPGARGQEADAGELDHLAALQLALRVAASVTVFDPQQQRALAQLAGVPIRCAPLPATPPPAPQPIRADAVVINHLADPAFARAVRAEILASLPVAAIHQADATAAGPGRDAVAHAVLPAKIHVHVGSARAALVTWRVVDSHAAQRAVVHVQATPHTGLAAAERMQMTIEPLRTGLAATTAAEAAEAVLRLIADAAAADAFHRHADRVVEQFNRTIEDAMWDAPPPVGSTAGSAR